MNPTVRQKHHAKHALNLSMQEAGALQHDKNPQQFEFLEEKIMFKWLNQRALDIRQKDEIGKLKEKNAELMAKLKRLSQELDDRITKLPKKAQKQETPEGRSIKIEAEVDSLKKLAKVYQKEIGFFKSKSNVVTGYERFVELEKKIIAVDENNEECARKIRELEKKTKSGDKELERLKKLKDSNSERLEEEKLLAILGKEMATTESLDKKMKQQIDLSKKKETAAADLLIKINLLEKEVSELKTQALLECEKTNEENEDSVDLLEYKEMLRLLQLKCENEAKKSAKEIAEGRKELENLAFTLKELEKRNKTNTHKIHEFTRTIRINKIRSEGKYSVNKSMVEKRRDEITARLEKTRKYRKLRLKQRGSLPQNGGASLKESLLNQTVLSTDKKFVNAEVQFDTPDLDM